VVSRLIGARRRRVVDPALDALARLGPDAGAAHLSLRAAVQDLAKLAESAGRLGPAELADVVAHGLSAAPRKKDKKRRKKA
jgi:hypothetical protein